MSADAELQSPTEPFSRLAIVRAGFIALVLAVHGLAAAPLPHVVTRRDLESPVAAEEVDRWAQRLTALGYTISPQELGEKVISITGLIGGTHRALLRPFRPMFRYTGTGQGWGLFANPDIFPSRLEIRAQRGGDWQTVYLRLDPMHRWGADVLTFRRVRGIYDAGGYGKRPQAPYRRFADWIGRRLLESDPEVTAVEVRMLRTHTTLRGQRPDDKVTPRHTIEVRR